LAGSWAKSSTAPAAPARARAASVARAARFAAEGFERTRLADVARDAGVAVGTIYLRHRDKAALLAAVLADLEGRFAAAMDAPELWAIPWPARFEAVFAGVLAQAAASPQDRRLMALAVHAEAEGWQRGQTIRAAIARHIAEGQASGAFRTAVDPPLAAAIAFGMVDGALAAVGAPGGPTPAGAARHLADAAARWLCR
jgi:AcrR family transcriptional regulator